MLTHGCDKEFNALFLSFASPYPFERGRPFAPGGALLEGDWRRLVVFNCFPFCWLSAVFQHQSWPVPTRRSVQHSKDSKDFSGTRKPIGSKMKDIRAPFRKKSAEPWVACWTLLGGLTERGYPEPFVLLLLRSSLAIQLRSVGFFVFLAVFPPKTSGTPWTPPRHPWTPWTPLHPPPHPSFF